MADDKAVDAETEDSEEETAASDTEASASTGSMTEEPPEEGATGAAEPAEAAGPESQADQSELEEEPDTDLDADPDAGLDDNNATGTDVGTDDDRGTGSEFDADPDPDDHGLEHTRKSDVDGDRANGRLTDRVRNHDAVERVRQSDATDAVDTSDPVVLAAIASVLFSWYQFYVRDDRQYGLFVGLWAPTLLGFADYLQNADVADAVQQFRNE